MTIARLLARPPATALVLLMRHAARAAIPAGDPGHAIPLTRAGAKAAHALGARLSGRLATLHTSPVPRCLQTATALASGAGSSATPIEDRLLGNPGVFVEDDRRAWDTFAALGVERVLVALAMGELLPGFAPRADATRRLLRHVDGVVGERSGVHVFVTHDVVVLPAASEWLGRPLAAADAPAFLDGVVLWRAGGGWVAHFRGMERPLPR